MLQHRAFLLHAAYTAIDTGRFADALPPCHALREADAADPEATLLLGLAHGALGDTDQAAALLHRVAAARPNHAHPAHDLAALLCRLDRAAEATAQYHAALRLSPDHAPLRRGLVHHLLATTGAAAAAAAFGPPGSGAADQHLAGLIAAESGALRAAIGHFRAAVAADPGPPAGWSNLGIMLKIVGQHDEAAAAHDQAVARAPQDAQLRVNRAVALLHAGRWAEAWHDYEWRLRLPGHTTLPLDRLLPALPDAGDLTGRTVLLTHEEGYGDTLQFLRYAPLLQALGARVLLSVPPNLARLAAQIAPVVPAGAAYDFHCPFFSLPRVFATTPDTIPAPIPYLRAAPGAVVAWRARLAALGPGPRIGLVWAGQARPWLPGFATLNARRSARLADFAPLAKIPAVFVSLQAGPEAAQAATPPPGLRLFDPMAEVADFADTAAIVAALDRVISVDTAMVHLAGALGQPSFLLDRLDHCWRWLPGRTDSPWYPGLRIFRQTVLGDWTEPMQAVAAALAAG